jgi:hypothetical protein
MKTYTALIIITLLAIACQKQTTNSPALTAQSENSSSTASHYIGEAFGGGIVFSPSPKCLFSNAMCVSKHIAENKKRI